MTSPFLVEQIARQHQTVLADQAVRSRHVRRPARDRRGHRFRSQVGWWLVGTGLALAVPRAGVRAQAVASRPARPLGL